MDDGHLKRVVRQAGVADPVGMLADRLSPADLTSLLLAVYRRRAATLTPAKVLDTFEHSRFAGTAAVGAPVMSAFDAIWLSVLSALGFEGLELSPVSPLGTISTVTSVDQNKVMATARNSEVLADSTNVLALESALRRRALLREDPRSREPVRLCASHRLVRGQLAAGPGVLPHFRMMALTTAGRAEESFQFELKALREHLAAHLRMLDVVTGRGLSVNAIRVSITDLTEGTRHTAVEREVMTPLASQHPAVEFGFDDTRQAGRGYYRDMCFFIHATNSGGERLLLTDGGFTDWTALMLSNSKERLLISGLGTERLLLMFGAVTATRPVVVAANPRWAQAARSLATQIQTLAGPVVRRVEHIGSTAIPDMAAKDVLDLQASVGDLGLDLSALSSLGFVKSPFDRDHVPASRDDDPALWRKQLWTRRGTGIDVNLHVRLTGSPNERLALLFRDFLRTHPAAVAAYARFKETLSGYMTDTGSYADVKDPVVDLVIVFAEEWAARTGWTPG